MFTIRSYHKPPSEEEILFPPLGNTYETTNDISDTHDDV